MLRYEIKKNFSVKLMLVLCLIYLFATIIFIIVMLGVKNGDNVDAQIALYDHISGACTEEKIVYINELYDDVKETLADENIMRGKYLSGEISLVDYKQYVEHFHECRMIESAVTELKNSSEEMAVGEDYFVFDLYYSKLFSLGRSLVGPLLSLIVMVISLSKVEKKKCTDILIVTKTGTGRIAEIKLKLLIVLSFIYATVYSLTEYIIAYMFHPYEQLDIPANSISNISGLPDRTSIFEWLILFYFIKLIILIIISLISMTVYKKAHDR